MLVPFGIVLGTGVFFTLCALRRKRENSATAPVIEPAFDPVVLPAGGLFRTSLFEQPRRWLAVKSTNSTSVQCALGLHHPTACSWEEGLVEAHYDKLFVSPAI